ncbi:hypothetical protein FDP22_15610 [Paroceanicella profunda]|uniref:Uncharacterized protein n=1 Tax=Paroceanicella profunda TaxID=2579971 RepID=A0A5B8FX15_9RHOB|nr:hypothetical protein [Paroceanicella profunda]QDL93085.1 hypothetical protein FDP22_15610 [Paroceanicella profunda]
MSKEQLRSGSRFLYEPFDSAHARIETHERVSEERWSALERRLSGIESAIERLERRLWLAVYGVAGAMLSQLVYEFASRAGQ